MSKKSKKSTTKGKVAKSSEEAAQVPAKLEPAAPTPFTRSQLASLVFLLIGCLKIMELSTAYKEGIENPTSCLSYLGEAHRDTCTHPSFNSLILAKYYSGLALAAYLFSGMLLLWNSEEVFQKFTICFVMGPVACTSFATLATQHFLVKNRAWHLLIVTMVMYTLSAPKKIEQIPFITHRLKINTKTMPSITLMGLAAFSSWELLRVAFSSDVLSNSLLVTASPLPEAAKTLVVFWMVDKFSMVLLYVFSIFHFDIPTQRGFLFFVALVKLCEFGIQHFYMDEPFHSEGILEAATISLAVASAVAFYGPLI